MRGSLPKLKEKLLEALKAVLPIIGIVLVLCFSVAPISPSILLCFLLGAAMIIVGMMFFTLGAEASMTPMGERVGSAVTRSRSLGVIIVMGFLLGFLITISEPDLQVLAGQVPAVPNMTLILSVAAGVGAFLIFTVSPVKALLFLVFISVLQQLEGNLIYPKVVGSSIGLPGIWVLAAVTVGGSLLGLAGMVVSVPIAAVAYTLLKNDLRARLSAQGTPPAPEEPGPEA